MKNFSCSDRADLPDDALQLQMVYLHLLCDLRRSYDDLRRILVSTVPLAKYSRFLPSACERIADDLLSRGKIF